MTDQTTAQFNQEAADYAAMDINPATEIAAMTTPASDDEPAPAEAPADRDHCGCCGNPADEAPAGLHDTCCRDLHDTIPAADETGPYSDSRQTLINQAHAIHAIHGTDNRRDYLRSVGSQFADSGIDAVEAAFTGRLLNMIASLADALQREINRA